jgi:hypothetical protein
MEIDFRLLFEESPEVLLVLLPDHPGTRWLRGSQLVQALQHCRARTLPSSSLNPSC